MTIQIFELKIILKTPKNDQIQVKEHKFLNALYMPGVGYGFFMVGGTFALDFVAYLFMCLSFKNYDEDEGKQGYSRRIISPSSLPDRFDTVDREAPDPYRFHRSYGDIFDVRSGANFVCRVTSI